MPKEEWRRQREDEAQRMISDAWDTDLPEYMPVPRVNRSAQPSYEEETDQVQLIVAANSAKERSRAVQCLTGLHFSYDDKEFPRFPIAFTFCNSSESDMKITIRSVEAEPSTKMAEFATWASKYTHPHQLDDAKYIEILDHARDAMNLRKVNDASDERAAYSRNLLQFKFQGPMLRCFVFTELPTCSSSDLIRDEDQEAWSELKKPRWGDILVTCHNSKSRSQAPRLTEDHGAVVRDSPRAPGSSDRGNVKRAEKSLNGTRNIAQEQSAPERKKILRVHVIISYLVPSALDELDEEGREARFKAEYPGPSNPRYRRSVPSEQLDIKELVADLHDFTGVIFTVLLDNLRLHIEMHLDTLEKRSRRLPPPPMGLSDIRTSLSSAMTQFTVQSAQMMEHDALTASPPSDRSVIRLAASIHSLNTAFFDDMLQYGHHRSIDECPTTDVPSRVRATAIHEAPHWTNTKDVTKECDSLGALIPIIAHSFGDAGSLKSEIRNRCNSTRGIDLGVADPLLLPQLFEDQTSRWRFLTLKHMGHVIACFQIATKKLLWRCTSNEWLTERILKKLQPEFWATYTKAVQHAEFLLQVENGDRLETLNHDFMDSIRKARQERHRRGAMGGEFETTASDQISENASAPAHDLNAEDRTVNEMYDMLRAYYDVACKRFTDAVSVQAIDFFLLRAPQSPLCTLCPEWVLRLSDTELEELAKEPEDLKKKRIAVESELACLREARIALKTESEAPWLVVPVRMARHVDEESDPGDYPHGTLDSDFTRFFD